MTCLLDNDWCICFVSRTILRRLATILAIKVYNLPSLETRSIKTYEIYQANGQTAEYFFFTHAEGKQYMTFIMSETDQRPFPVLKPRTDDQVFLDKEPCSKAGMTSFWTRLLVKEKLVNLRRTHERIKLVKEKLGRLCGALIMKKNKPYFAD